MKKNLIFSMIAIFLASSCNNDFLEFSPKTSLTEETAFLSYENFKTYSWSLYGIFQDGLMRQNLRNAGGNNAIPIADGDVMANYLYLSNSVNTQQNIWQ